MIVATTTCKDTRTPEKGKTPKTCFSGVAALGAWLSTHSCSSWFHPWIVVRDWKQGVVGKRGPFEASMFCRFSQKNPHAHKNKIGTSTPPLKKPRTPPSERRNYMGMGVFQQKEPKNARRPQNWCSHFRPRIAGGNFMDITPFLIRAFRIC